MKPAPFNLFIPVLSLLAGAMDFFTGVLLMTTPRLTFRLMGLAEVEDVAFVRFIGAFVASVGLTYLWGLYRGSLKTTWEFTALVRGCVGFFVTIAIARHVLELGWLTVAATDLGLAGLQVFFLQKGWVSDEP
jgi:hypothetical protein